ncbi:hypothetical protein PCANC_10595 [Puccinia coronata f. sp. avenae]|uniref:Uncharacterized protein n=1 Tax=Puccinia coronata f. sp. avenae TaxID=200324 RepID=A0A2N5SRI7_9BASI|nr:hypothetical protein PCANC_20572 [Puccinia coronata f. sp. avenae]PLW52494.1 hypothetical protein PCANC_10595 [Puccinia coronata f. sp. avenae]
MDQYCPSNYSAYKICPGAKQTNFFSSVLSCLDLQEDTPRRDFLSLRASAHLRSHDQGCHYLVALDLMAQAAQHQEGVCLTKAVPP